MDSLICDFIRANPQWLAQLTQYPYNLSVKKLDGTVLITSTTYDKHLPIVREASKGVLIDMSTLKPITMNYLEENHEE